MKYLVSFAIEDGNAKSVEAQAISKNHASIFITAATMKDAAELMEQGEKLALEACQNWKPEEQPPVKEKPQEKHYIISRRSVEEMEASAAAYEASPAGQRFIKMIDKAADFKHKNIRGGITVAQFVYLLNKHKNDLMNGSSDLEALYYQYGYRDGKAAGKK